MANGEDLYAIHEAYYENDKPISLTEEAANPQGETLNELKDDFAHYLRALEPVLEFSDFDKSAR